MIIFACVFFEWMSIFLLESRPFAELTWGFGWLTMASRVGFCMGFFFGGFFRDGLVGSRRGVHGICKTNIWKILAYDKHTVRVSKTGITSFSCPMNWITRIGLSHMSAHHIIRPQTSWAMFKTLVALERPCILRLFTLFRGLVMSGKLISQWNSIGNTMKKSPKHNNSKKLLSFYQAYFLVIWYTKWSFIPRFPRFPKHHPHLHACHNGLPCFFIRLHKEATVPRENCQGFPPIHRFACGVIIGWWSPLLLGEGL